MHTSGRMVFAMTLLAAATPFVLPRVLAPSGTASAHVAAVGNPHPANLGNPHPADFGNAHPANFGDPHPALNADTHTAYPVDSGDEENVTIDPSQVQGHVTFAFPHAAHVTIVLPEGVQFAVNDTRGFGQPGVGRSGGRNVAVGNTNEWPGFAPLVPPALQTNINLNPGAQVVTDSRTGQLQPPPAMAVATNRSQNPINEPAGAQQPLRFRELRQH
jgi:hypothetical protein